jgi:hypothetical protein
MDRDGRGGKTRRGEIREIKVAKLHIPLLEKGV